MVLAGGGWLVGGGVLFESRKRPSFALDQTVQLPLWKWRRAFSNSPRLYSATPLASIAFSLNWFIFKALFASTRALCGFSNLNLSDKWRFWEALLKAANYLKTNWPVQTLGSKYEGKFVFRVDTDGLIEIHDRNIRRASAQLMNCLLHINHVVQLSIRFCLTLFPSNSFIYPWRFKLCLSCGKLTI